MNKTEKLQYCSGCEDDFYNGKNPYMIKECWSLETAELVEKKEVHINQRPPWKQKPIEVLSCFKRRFYVYVNPKNEH